MITADRQSLLWRHQMENCLSQRFPVHSTVIQLIIDILTAVHQKRDDFIGKRLQDTFSRLTLFRDFFSPTISFHSIMYVIFPHKVFGKLYVLDYWLLHRNFTFFQRISKMRHLDAHKHRTLLYTHSSFNFWIQPLFSHQQDNSHSGAAVTPLCHPAFTVRITIRIVFIAK